MRYEDDLTYKLGEVIKASTNVRKSEQEGSYCDRVRATPSGVFDLVCLRPVIVSKYLPVPCSHVYGQ